MALSFSVFNKFRAIDDVSRPMRKMERSAARFGRRTTREFKRADRAASGFSKSVKGLVGLAAAGLSVQVIVSGLTDAVTVGAQFEQTIVSAAAKFGDMAQRGTRNFRRLEDAAKLAGKTTEFTAAQAAEGLNFLAMAGFNAEQSISALPGVIDLATAAQVELSMASDMATDTLGAFNLMSKDTIQLQKNLARVNDVLAKTTTSANVNMEQLFETFTEAGPVASGLGANIETVAAMAGTLGNAGIKASQAGTTLKNVFVRLSAATPEATKQLDRLRIKLKNSQGNFRDIFDILQDLNKGLEGLGDVERAAVLNDIFGKIPIAGVNVLLKTGAEGLREYRKELENATGASQKMASMMRDTTQTRFKTFLSAIESIKITGFEALREVIDSTSTDLTGFARDLESFLRENKQPIAEFASVVVKITGAVGKLLFKLAQFDFIQMKRRFDFFKAIFTGISNAIESTVNWLDQFMNRVNSGILNNLGMGVEDQRQREAARAVVVSPNAGAIERTMSEVVNRSTVDVNLNNLPQGTEVKKNNLPPGFKLRMGFSGAE